MQTINKEQILADYCINNRSHARKITNYVMAQTGFKKYDARNDDDKTDDLLQSFFLNMWENFSLSDSDKSQAYLDQSLKMFIKSQLRQEIRFNAHKNKVSQYNLCDSHSKNTGSSSNSSLDHEHNSLSRNQNEEKDRLSCLQVRRAVHKFMRSLKNKRDRNLAYEFFEANLSVKDAASKYNLAMSYTSALKKKLAIKAQQFLLNEGITPSNFSN
jgi:hypothetical protein